MYLFFYQVKNYMKIFFYLFSLINVNINKNKLIGKKKIIIIIIYLELRIIEKHIPKKRKKILCN